MANENVNQQINSTSDKPYNVNISIGICEFICSTETDLTAIMNEADKLLYENKRYKNNTSLKNPNDIHKLN
jgi:PleD family two-component response regulator